MMRSSSLAPRFTQCQRHTAAYTIAPTQHHTLAHSGVHTHSYICTQPIFPAHYKQALFQVHQNVFWRMFSSSQTTARLLE